MNTLIWITCHKYEQYLPEALMSAHSQTVPCPVFVAHDACTGGEPVGLSANRNKALPSTLCKYLLFLDADDTIPPNYVEELERAANGDMCVVTCPAKMFGDQEGTITPNMPVTMETLLAGNTLHCAALVPGYMLSIVGGYDVSLQAWEDWELWCKLLHAGVEFRSTDKTHLNYRRHADSMNRRYNATMDEMRERLKQKYDG